ncbi:hypothetical protein DFJ58DRAFT_729546 [Suillus subalutaceus]|uniref:uncharacterized protein n=1 Tax=Suillus subalutaceus TaxID=48586 RepID=UPI001B880E3D|nr:uncharacterized protein DFJ58DRAFT_729546 [Suillus subalutaceus]KAG1849466.1 hypothetical protein DFJ58DRAFT_729546 [Suillus subalutaceus]
MVMVFGGQPQDEFEGFLLCIHLMKAEVPMTWGNYSNSTRWFDSFRNEWDLCDQLDSTSTPNGDWEEDNFNFLDPIPDPLPPPPPAPPSLSSFLQDICNYFRRHEVAPLSDYTEGVEHFVTHLWFHLVFHLAASTTRSIGGSATFESWVKKQKFSHVCNIVEDSGKDVDSISDVQKHIITCFDAVPFGQILSLNGETHFDDDLLEEEVDFICGPYYVYTNALKNCLGGQGLRPGLGQGWMWGSGLLNAKASFRHALETYSNFLATKASAFTDN